MPAAGLINKSPLPTTVLVVIVPVVVMFWLPKSGVTLVPLIAVAFHTPVAIVPTEVNELLTTELPKVVAFKTETLLIL